MSESRFLISGGGTGGHVYPAIAIADALRDKDPEAEITFVGTRNKMEWIAVPKAGYPIEEIWISGLQRRLTLKNLSVPFKLLASLRQARKIIKKHNPDAVICTGGYVSGPIGYMAAKMGIPLFLQEQNSYPGMTTRLLSGKAALIFTAFEAAREYLPPSKILLYGNPTRKSILSDTGKEAYRHFNFDPQKKTLLVLGGSGGAKAINDAVMRNLETLHSELELQIIWQSGDRYLEAIESVINPEKLKNLRLYSFIDHMPHAYSAADIIMSRAGAGICSELQITGKPSILVPSPNVAGDHQTKNAEAMQKEGAAVMITDSKIKFALVEQLRRMISEPERLKSMQQAALKMAKPDAAEAIADKIITIINQSRKLPV